MSTNSKTSARLWFGACAIMAFVMVTLIYGVFDQLLALPWPPTLLGQWLPVFKMIPSV